MKKVLLVLVCAASFTALNAQGGVRFGAKAGLNLSNITGSDAGDLKMKPGFHVGAVVTIPVSESFSVNPEAVFSAQGAKDEDDVKYNLNYINVPVMATFNTASGFFAQTGPQIGFLMSAKAKADGESVDIKEGFKSTDFAWGFGVGFNTQSGFGVGARYNVGLSSLDEAGDAKVKNSVIQISAIWNFGGGAAASKASK